MKIVVLDGSSLMSDDVSWEGLEALGELTVYKNSSNDTEELVSRIGDAEIVITNKKNITAAISYSSAGSFWNRLAVTSSAKRSGTTTSKQKKDSVRSSERSTGHVSAPQM